ncbi:MAG: ABC transporter permease [Acidobacteria bacterium]|nr:ABC transporter permease [Acidobacteriota bacterium]
MSLLRVLHAELLKLKRTLAFRVIFVLPLLVALLQFFALLRSKAFGADFKLWETLPSNMLAVWAVFMMPLLITLETALLNGIEHGDRQWKHLCALPVPRHAIYLAKFFVAQGLTAASTLVLCVLTALVGLAVMRLRPELAHSGSVPYGWLAKYAGLVWLASWLIIAIHTWVSIRWSGFAVALGVGIGGTFFALFAASASAGEYYPWLLPMNVFKGERFTTALLLGVGGGAVAALLGCLEFVRRDVA